MTQVKLRSRRRANQRGITLIEVMVCVGILAVAVVGMGMTILQISKFNTYNNNRSVAHRAAQKMLEVMATEDTLSLLSRNNTTQNVLGMEGIDGTGALGISVSEVGWDGVTTGLNKVLLLKVRVSDGAGELGNYAYLESVRTNY